MTWRAAPVRLANVRYVPRGTLCKTVRPVLNYKQMCETVEAIHVGGVALRISFLAVTGDYDDVTLCRLVGGCGWSAGVWGLAET